MSFDLKSVFVLCILFLLIALNAAETDWLCVGIVTTYINEAFHLNTWLVVKPVAGVNVNS